MKMQKLWQIFIILLLPDVSTPEKTINYNNNDGMWQSFQLNKIFDFLLAVDNR